MTILAYQMYLDLHEETYPYVFLLSYILDLGELFPALWSCRDSVSGIWVERQNDLSARVRHVHYEYPKHTVVG